MQEIQNGNKQSHWMWFIFPQLAGLGHSETAKFYEIQDKAEAIEYLAHPLLGSRLIEISEALLQIDGKSANQIFGTPDDMKLRSCMTLFASLPKTNPVFTEILKKYYNDIYDANTLALIG